MEKKAGILFQNGYIDLSVIQNNINQFTTKTITKIQCVLYPYLS